MAEDFSRLSEFIPKEDDDKMIIDRFKKKSSEWYSFYNENNRNYHTMWEFGYSKDGQYTEDEIKEYKIAGKPRLSHNLIPRLYALVMGEYSYLSTDVKVEPYSAQSVKQADIDLRENSVRYVEKRSDAISAKDHATECAMVGGYGAFRIESELENSMGFSYIPAYKKIKDPTVCFWDAFAEDENKVDGDCCGYQSINKKTTVSLEYGIKEEDLENVETWNSGAFIGFKNIGEDEVVLADYFEKQYYNRKVTLLSNSMVVDPEDAVKFAKEETEKASFEAHAKGLPTPPKITIVKEKENVEKTCYIIRRYVLGGDRILERTIWDSTIFGLIFQPGMLVYDRYGKEETLSLHQFLVDIQRTYNYAKSEIVFRSQLSRYEPFLLPGVCIPKGQKAVEMWENTHLAKSALIYNPGPRGERPERITPQGPPQELFLLAEQSYSTFQQISGRDEAVMGAPGNERSAVAIQSRQRPGNVIVSALTRKNPLKAADTAANCVLSLLKNIYDTERRINIMDKTEKVSSVVINSDGGKNNNLTNGDYKVYVTAGASFALQQEDSLNTLIKLLPFMPAVGPKIPDELMKLSNIKNSPKIIERIHEWVNPDIAAEEATDPEEKQKYAQKAQQMMQPHQQAQQMAQMGQQMNIIKMKTDAMSDQIKAQAAQMTANANLMNAKTKRMEVGHNANMDQAEFGYNAHADAKNHAMSHVDSAQKFVETKMKVDAEMNKSQNEVLKTAIQSAKTGTEDDFLNERGL